MPLLFSLAIRDASKQAQWEFRTDEHLRACLDDVTFTSPPTTFVWRMMETACTCRLPTLHREHVGGEPCVRVLGELGPEVWNPEGVKILGTVAGSIRFAEEPLNKKLEEETVGSDTCCSGLAGMADRPLCGLRCHPMHEGRRTQAFLTFLVSKNLRKIKTQLDRDRWRANAVLTLEMPAPQVDSSTSEHTFKKVV